MSFRFNPFTAKFDNVRSIGKLDARYLQISNNLSDLANAGTARTNLGLVAGGAGDIWVEKAGDIMTSTLQINVPTETNEGLIIKSTDDNITKNRIQIRKADDSVLSFFDHDGYFLINKTATVQILHDSDGTSYYDTDTGAYGGVGGLGESQIYLYGSTAGAVLDVSAITTNRIVAFPDSAGTFALLEVANVFTTTQQINVATATDEALILKTTDDNTTKNLLEMQNSDADILSHVNADGSFHIGDATNYITIGIDGDIILHGTACVWKYDDLSPANIGLPNTDPPELDDYLGFPFQRYDDGGIRDDEQVFYLWHVPSDFAVGDASVRGHFGLFVDNPPTTPDGNEIVAMGFQYTKISDNEVFAVVPDGGGSIEETIVEDEAVYTWHETATGVCTTTGWAAGDIILFRFFRDTSGVYSANDDYTGDAWVGAYHLEFLSCRIGGDT